MTHWLVLGKQEQLPRIIQIINDVINIKLKPTDKLDVISSFQSIGLWRKGCCWSSISLFRDGLFQLLKK